MNTNLRAALLGLLVAVPPALAEKPAVGEGIVIRLEPGYTLWALDAERIQRQTQLPPGEVQSMLVDQAQSTLGMTLGLGYNIKGHATVALALSGTTWDLGSVKRGGAGFGALEAAWHPLQLVQSLRDRTYDISFFGGAGYFLLGEQRALDGLHLQTGARAEYYLSPMISVGAAVRYLSLHSKHYVLDWDKGTDVPLPDGSGGSLLIPSLTLALHVPIGLR